MTPEEIDAASRAVQKTPNRITLEFIEGQIAWKHISSAAAITRDGRFKYSNAEPLVPPPEVCDRLLAVTICTLVMKNGWVVIGHSAPLDPANFNAEHGQRLAYDQCIKQLWPLFAFARLDFDTLVKFKDVPTP